MEPIWNPEYIPKWLRPPREVLPTKAEPLPDWLTSKPQDAKPTKEGKALLLMQYEMAFPDILERMRGGLTLTAALREYPIKFDVGPFTTWLYKDAEREAMYADVKRVRAEVWTGEMIAHATGEKMEDIDRSKVAIDTYKWLISRHARKEYGDTKTIEMNTTISIKAALTAANERVIDARVIEDDDEPPSYGQLSAADEDENDE